MTKLVKTISEWRKLRNSADYASKSIGFVPTMGGLHEGHLSLMRRSLEENDITVSSIFLNPTQFNNQNDLATYPAEFEKDLAMLNELGVDACFSPQYDDIYNDNYRYRVSENALSEKLCGAHRPGHFGGVLTIVLKLFTIVRPHKAYFGEKDYQQLLLVRDMVEAFFLDLEIVPCPIIREPDGLAMSSRNARLSPAGREKAPLFYKILNQNKDCTQIKEELTLNGFEVDYVEEHFNRRFGAVSLDDVRLIDNVEI
jgi:pantoate--beta-alanine ligase